MEVSGRRHSSADLLTITIGEETGWAPEPVWALWTFFLLSGIEPQQSGPYQVEISTELSRILPQNTAETHSSMKYGPHNDKEVLS
jgi:hypothetical protein